MAIRWFSVDFPEANIGIVCGKISGIVVVDCDTQDYERIKKLHLPNTRTVKTGRGYHFYFRYPDDFEVENINHYEGFVDIQSDGKYVVAPPSIHSSGSQYKWHNEEEMTEFPKNIFPKKASREKGSKKFKKILTGVPGGDRNNSLASFVGSIIKVLPEEEWRDKAWPAITEWNKNNIPPLGADVLESTFESICNRELEQRDEKEKIAIMNHDFKALMIAKQAKEALHQTAKFLADKFHAITIREKRAEIYIYENGLYILGEPQIRAEIQVLLEEFYTAHFGNEILEKIKNITLKKREECWMDENFINLENGVFDIKNNVLHSHDPKFIFFSKIPVNYDPNATCPKIENFLTEILSEEDIPVIQEWFGFSLFRRYLLKKAIIFLGKPDTGKTTLLNLFKKFIGIDNISGISLQRIATDKFVSANLYNKHLNIYDDLSVRDISDNGQFKIAVGGGLMSGEFKFGNQFQFMNHSKLTFACNQIPQVKDLDDEAYFSRWILIRFENFIKSKNPNLIDEISTEEEMSGLLNFAIKGLWRILENKKFSYDKPSMEIKNEMLRSSSSIAGFIQDKLEESHDGWLSKENLYDEYVKYCKEKDLPTETMDKVGKNLHKLSGFILDRKMVGTRGWAHVKIND